MPAFVLPKDFMGYPAGTVLRDVPLREARAMECNRCGLRDCCDGTMEDVVKDEATGFPLLVWGSRYPADFYEERYGKPLIQPLVRGDGGIVVGDAFEVDADGREYTAFKCSALKPCDDGTALCGIRSEFPNPDPKKLEQMQPRSCGEFPIFGLDVDATIIDGHPFVPPVGALPRCTWYGMRIVGPWKNTPKWVQRWEAACG